MFSTVFSGQDDGIPTAFLLDAAIDREREARLDNGVNDCVRSRGADGGVMAATTSTGRELHAGCRRRRPRKAGRRPS
jgi:hypothetical protein